jgi:hypothetical protein
LLGLRAEVCPNQAIATRRHPHFLIDADKCTECLGDFAEAQCASASARSKRRSSINSAKPTEPAGIADRHPAASAGRRRPRLRRAELMAMIIFHDQADVSRADLEMSVAPGVHWIGAFDPDLRSFDIILRTANGTSYNAYAVRGEPGVAIIDTVKENFSADLLSPPGVGRRLRRNHHHRPQSPRTRSFRRPARTAAARAAGDTAGLSPQARLMLQGLFDPAALAGRIAVGTGDSADLGDRHAAPSSTRPTCTGRTPNAPGSPPKASCFSGDFLGCHFCDARLFNDAVGDFRFSFDYYYAHIMRPFRGRARRARPDRTAAAADHRARARADPAPGSARLRAPLPRALGTPPARRRHEDAAGLLHLGLRRHPAHGRSGRGRRRIGVDRRRRSARLALRPRRRRAQPFVDLIEEADALVFGSPTINGDAVKPVWDLLSSLTMVDVKGKLGAAFGSYGWSGEAVPMIEDRLRRLKLRVPLPGVKAR